jgi:uncharacterized membrane protein
MSPIEPPTPPVAARPRSFRRAVIRGLALILPPILTIVVFLWMIGTVRVYLLKPVTDWTREALVWAIWDVRSTSAELETPTRDFDGRTYVRLPSNEYIPQKVADGLHLAGDAGSKSLPDNAREAYERYVDLHYLRPAIVLPVFLVVFVAVLWVLGKLFAAGMGNIFEPLMRRLPLIRGVYASVKKVTDFVFVEDEVEFKRVVAIEFPRPGVWTVGLVTGEGMRDIAGAAGEPCVTVAIPGSPVPFTGNVVTVPKSAAHDLNITIDEALQFFISCGVVVPTRELRDKAASRSLSQAATPAPSPAEPEPI